MSEWKECKLGDVISSNKQSIDKNYSHRTILYLDTGSITRGKIDGYQEYLLSDVPSRAKRLVKNNDIIYSTVRPIQRHYGFIINPPDNLVVSTGFSVIETDRKKADPLFIYYLLTSDEIVETLDVIAEASTSAYPSLRPSDIENLDILLPPIPEQRAIASVLSSLDDKIDLLHRQNKTLEAMAETLFRQWFVEEADWDGTLSEYIKVQGGFAFRSSDFKESGTNRIVKITNISMGRVDIDRTQFVDDVIVNNLDRNKFKINSGDILIAMTGAEIGKIGIVEKTYRSIWLNQRVGKLIPVVPYGEYIGYLALKSPEGQDYIINACSGSAQENISSSKLEEMRFFSYSIEKTEFFGKKVKSMFEKIIFNLSQIRTLEKLRDTLLPKLMSGEVRVKV